MDLSNFDAKRNDLRDLSINGDPLNDCRALGTAVVCMGLTGLFCAVLPVLGYLAAYLRWP